MECLAAIFDYHQLAQQWHQKLQSWGRAASVWWKCLLLPLSLVWGFMTTSYSECILLSTMSPIGSPINGMQSLSLVKKGACGKKGGFSELSFLLCCIMGFPFVMPTFEFHLIHYWFYQLQRFMLMFPNVVRLCSSLDLRLHFENS